MTDTSGGQPAGWYADPEMVDTIRYWDGSAWTDHRAQAGTRMRAHREPVRPQATWAKWTWWVILAAVAFVLLLVAGGVIEWLEGLQVDR